jgi:hypothetical protein
MSGQRGVLVAQPLALRQGRIFLTQLLALA